MGQGQSLGVYLPGKFSSGVRSRISRELALTGMVGDCAGLAKFGAMPLGYCHYHSEGLYLAVAAVR
jgi:hypothetical protein